MPQSTSSEQPRRRLGYARHLQTEPRDRQRALLSAAGCQEIFEDAGSSVSEDRRGLLTLMRTVAEGDEVVVADAARLSRRMDELVDLWAHFTSRGARIRFLGREQVAGI